MARAASAQNRTCPPVEVACGFADGTRTRGSAGVPPALAGTKCWRGRGGSGGGRKAAVALLQTRSGPVTADRCPRAGMGRAAPSLRCGSSRPMRALGPRHNQIGAGRKPHHRGGLSLGGFPGAGPCGEDQRNLRPPTPKRPLARSNAIRARMSVDDPPWRRSSLIHTTPCDSFTLPGGRRPCVEDITRESALVTTSAFGPIRPAGSRHRSCAIQR
jgi:hypothetical protein